MRIRLNSKLINRFHIIGIISIAFGSIIVFYQQPILGAIIVAIGTFALTYGGSIFSKLQSDQTLSEINNRIEQFEKNLFEANNINYATQREVEINNIKSEYLEWAKCFKPQKDDIELAHKKKELSKEETLLNESKEVQPYYQFFIDSLDNYIDAYNKSRHAQIIKFRTIRELENKFYKSEIERFNSFNSPYEAIVEFDNSVKWRIYIVNYVHSVNMLGGPQLNVIEIPFDTDQNKEVKDTIFILGIIFDTKKELISIKSNVAYIENLLKEKYSLKNYREETENVIRIILEYQLSMIE
jgi:hypothetical protein